MQLATNSTGIYPLVLPHILFPRFIHNLMSLTSPLGHPINRHSRSHAYKFALLGEHVIAPTRHPLNSHPTGISWSTMRGCCTVVLGVLQWLLGAPSHNWLIFSVQSCRAKVPFSYSDYFCLRNHVIKCIVSALQPSHPTMAIFTQSWG